MAEPTMTITAVFVDGPMEGSRFQLQRYIPTVRLPLLPDDDDSFGVVEYDLRFWLHDVAAYCYRGDW